MDTEKRTQRNLANARTTKTCPPNSTKTVYFTNNKPTISLPNSGAKFPKLKSKFPKFPE